MIERISAPNDLLERWLSACLRGFLKITFRSLIGSKLSVHAQRKWVDALALLLPGDSGIKKHVRFLGDISVTTLMPKRVQKDGVILFLHGGAFCLGNPYTHRSLCTRLGLDSGLPIWIPDYRLAPEHPYPAALQDAIKTYEAILKEGYAAHSIVIAGDSAGASLAFALAITLNKAAKSPPACVMMISPVTMGNTLRQKSTLGGREDPMLTMDWLNQSIRWFDAPHSAVEFAPLEISLNGLPPLLIQVGQEEMLLNDSLQLEAHALQSGVSCKLEIYLERWHVFHLQSFYLKSSRAAIRAMARFALDHIS